MTHNGYTNYTKNGLGGVKIGRYICPSCRETCEEERSFWKNMKNDSFNNLNLIFQRLRVNHVSYQGIALVMDLIFPRGKDTILRAFTDSVEITSVPPVKDYFIVHYDEQHPKCGRTQKYRLTLLDHVSAQPIADELYDKKDPETVKAFLGKYMDPDRPTFMVTDLYSSNALVMEEFFGKSLIHQFCLLHLNKLIIKDFPRNTTFKQELQKYQLLNIFYNREPDIKVLKDFVAQERIIQREKTSKEYKEWLKQEKKIFHRFLRRRENEKLPQIPYQEASKTFQNLKRRIDSFPIRAQKRLLMIEKNWEKLTAFYFVEGAPVTNNLLENHYSTSLKTHHKKQLRTDRRIKNHIKLSAMNKAGLIQNHGKTLIQTFLKFTPVLNID